MFHRAPAIDKIDGAIGWRPTIDLDGILADVIAYTRADSGAKPNLTAAPARAAPATIAPGTSTVR